MRAAAHAPCSQPCAQHVHCPNLELKSELVSRCSRIGGARCVGGGLVDTCLCSVHWSLQSVVTLRSLHNQKTRHSCHRPLLIPFMTYESILTTDGSIRIAIFITYGVLWLQRGNDYHGTPTAFLTNFTKTVKLTKTPIACHFWRCNSFSCDYFIKSWKLLESGFPDRYFGRSMLDCKPYCEQSSHRYRMYCIATCNAWDVHSTAVHSSQCCCCCCCCCCLVL